MEMNLVVSADNEKKTAALSSVVAAVALTTFKIIVGVLTGSLGILAEAAHSGLDLVAAVVTFLAVRISGKPADQLHNYGHGKIENLSALFETLLLLATCAWIIYEAVQRLFFKSVEVEVSIWSFLVMSVSIVIDYSRSRMLYRVAKKHSSQALEADALHFSTDIWSSSVVIVGLVGVLLSERVAGLAFLKQADAVAALGVALIVVYVSVELGIRTVKALIDTSPDGAIAQIKTIAQSIPGVIDCHDVRVRPSGPTYFIDVHITVDGSWSLEKTHELLDTVEKEIIKTFPDSDVTLHPEPYHQS